MQVAVFSDIHANLPAFEAILRDSDEVGVAERWCLGDVIGYGADPDLCVELARERCEVCLVGNHDLAVLGELDTSTFSSAAAAAVEWTTEHTSKPNLDFLAGLSPSDISHEAALYHASPRDPVWEYVLWPEQAADCLAVQDKRVSFVGHSHVALFFSAAADDDGNEAHGWQAGAGTRLEIDEGRWLINPGSVGQPRDGDPRAAWLELDTESWEATYHRVGYDIERAARSIEVAGLPEHLARRLFLGR
ncbi:MAG TPA: metallophosphoesterase family protein [Solirubrobacterales bacterium]|jgi:predicted phosphodiesterase|nr:metallophosphoesterase family protein [Solirubrobacterales bacterium]